MSAVRNESVTQRGTALFPLRWTAAGLAALLALTGAVANGVAAGSVGGAVAGVLVAVTVPGVLVLVAVGVQAALRRYGTDVIFGDVEIFPLPVIGTVGFMVLNGAALVFIGQSVRGFAVLGGVDPDWAWVFPLVLEAAFVAFAVAYVVASVHADALHSAEVSA